MEAFNATSLSNNVSKNNFDSSLKAQVNVTDLEVNTNLVVSEAGAGASAAQITTLQASFTKQLDTMQSIISQHLDTRLQVLNQMMEENS